MGTPAAPGADDPAARLHAHPGVMLAGYLEARGFSARECARRLKVSVTTVTNVLRQRNGITADMALGLEYVFDRRAWWWLALQMEYDLQEAEIARAARKKAKRGAP